VFIPPEIRRPILPAAPQQSLTRQNKIMYSELLLQPAAVSLPMNLPLAFIEGIGGPELMMIMFVILLLFGANKLPELARGLGKSVREFKKAASGVENEMRRAMEEQPTPPPAPKPVSAIPQIAPEKTDVPPPTAD
jgi:sec-independent protein translocase protein TatA